MSTPAVNDTANIGGTDYTVKRFILGSSTKYVVCDPDGHQFIHSGELSTFVRPAQNPTKSNKKTIVANGVPVNLA